MSSLIFIAVAELVERVELVSVSCFTSLSRSTWFPSWRGSLGFNFRGLEPHSLLISSRLGPRTLSSKPYIQWYVRTRVCVCVCVCISTDAYCFDDLYLPCPLLSTCPVILTTITYSFHDPFLTLHNLLHVLYSLMGSNFSVRFDIYETRIFFSLKNLPYSGKLSREKTFTLWEPPAKFFCLKFLGVPHPPIWFV